MVIDDGGELHQRRLELVVEVRQPALGVRLVEAVHEHGIGDRARGVEDRRVRDDPKDAVREVRVVAADEVLLRHLRELLDRDAMALDLVEVHQQVARAPLDLLERDVALRRLQGALEMTHVLEPPEGGAVAHRGLGQLGRVGLDERLEAVEVPLDHGRREPTRIEAANGRPRGQ